MDLLVRMRLLSQLLHAVGGEIEGRKKLHKLVYLCQASGVDLDQDYIFHFYGVFSPSLASDIDRAKEWGILVEEPAPSGYSIRLRECASPNDDAFTIARDLAKESPRVLESLSTIIYLLKAGYSGQRLIDKHHELKPQLKCEWPKAKELAAKYYDVHCD